MSSGVKVERKGPGLAALVRTVNGLGGAGVRWGVFEKAGRHRGDGGEGPHLASLLAIHELGARLPDGTVIPKREPMRIGTKAARAEVIKKAKDQLARAVGNLQPDPQAVLGPAGKVAADSIKRVIGTGQLDDLAEATIKARQRPGHDSAGTPLLDTRQLVEAITFKID